MMRLSLSLGLLASCTCITSLVGCNAGGARMELLQDANGKAVVQMGPSRDSVDRSYRVSAPLAFVANTSNEVQIYPANNLKKNPTPMATITDAVGCPSGLAMDRQGTLYVANDCAGNYSSYSVTEYPKGQTAHSLSITDGVRYPAGLAVDNSLTLYVSNVWGNGNISEYAAGATSPSRVISGQGITAPWGLTLDAKQNLYVADYVTDQIFKIPKGTSSANPLNLQGLKRPIGVAFDSLGNLWVADLKGFVNVYPPGKTSPIETISDGYTEPFAVSEDSAGTVLVANWEHPDVVYEYAPNQFSPEAALTKDVKTSTGVLIQKP